MDERCYMISGNIADIPGTDNDEKMLALARKASNIIRSHGMPFYDAEPYITQSDVLTSISILIWTEGIEKKNGTYSYSSAENELEELCRKLSESFGKDINFRFRQSQTPDFLNRTLNGETIIA